MIGAKPCVQLNQFFHVNDFCLNLNYTRNTGAMTTRGKCNWEVTTITTKTVSELEGNTLALVLNPGKNQRPISVWPEI